MNLTVGAIGVVVLAVIAGLWMFARRARQGGEAKVVADVATAAVEVVTDMADAQANAPQGKADVVKRLRENGL
jgi:uncharacterized protein YggE